MPEQQGHGKKTTEALGKRRQQILFKGLLRIPRYLGAMPGQMKRHVETHVLSTHGPEQAFVFPAPGKVAGQITNVFSRKNEGEGPFDLLRARRTHLPLEGLVTAQETVRVIDPITSL
jgi:hypothetical protein